jgi:hypothetical protein
MQELAFLPALDIPLLLYFPIAAFVTRKADMLFSEWACACSKSDKRFGARVAGF